MTLPETPPGHVLIRELAAWSLDPYTFRDQAVAPAQLTAAVQRARIHLPQTPAGPLAAASAIWKERTQEIQPLLAHHLHREDLAREYAGLDWTLAVVDLNGLLAFQRRLVLDPSEQTRTTPHPNDWPALLALALDMQRSTACSVARSSIEPGQTEFLLHSSNPDLRLVPPHNGGSFNLTLDGGPPFFEAAELRGRWFLRDGYHRAFHLLRAGVRWIPAVVLHVRSLEELGPTSPWFFAEDELFSARPPRVLDFLDDALTLTYPRLRLTRQLRITIQETLESLPTGDLP